MTLLLYYIAKELLTKPFKLKLYAYLVYRYSNTVRGASRICRKTYAHMTIDIFYEVTKKYVEYVYTIIISLDQVS